MAFRIQSFGLGLVVAAIGYQTLSNEVLRAAGQVHMNLSDASRTVKLLELGERPPKGKLPKSGVPFMPLSQKWEVEPKKQVQDPFKVPPVEELSPLQHVKIQWNSGVEATYDFLVQRTHRKD